MESFIYDFYGYKVDKLNDASFEYKGYTFLLAATSEDEQSITNLIKISDQIKNLMTTDIVYVVKNKYEKYISSKEDNNNICMLTYKNSNEASINDYVKMHVIFSNRFQYKVDLVEIIAMWEQRIEYIQNQCIVNLNFDNESHVELYENVSYAVGLALNAVSYLADLNIDYKQKYNTTLCHRRIKAISKFELFNPFNLIIDHSSRDLSELYKNELIDLKTLFDIFKYYQYKEEEIQYFLARLLFPSNIFDLLEDMYTDTGYSDTSFIYSIIKKQQKQIKLIKEFYINIIELSNIRPIRWLEKYS